MSVATLNHVTRAENLVNFESSLVNFESSLVAFESSLASFESQHVSFESQHVSFESQHVTVCQIDYADTTIHGSIARIRCIRAIIRCMNDDVQKVLDLSARLRELCDQLDRLDAERAAVKRQIDDCMAEMGTPRGENEPMPAGMANQIRWALRQHRDRPLAPIDVAAMLSLTSEADIANVRTLLARMQRDGRARKVAHGRYVTTE